MFHNSWQSHAPENRCKKTNITEQVKTVFAFDLINAFNRVEFADPAMDPRNRPAFGVITSQFADPRKIQLGRILNRSITILQSARKAI